MIRLYHKNNATKTKQRTLLKTNNQKKETTKKGKIKAIWKIYTEACSINAT